MLKSLLSLFFGMYVLSLSAQIIPDGGFESTNTNWKGVNFAYNSTLTVTNTISGRDSKLGPVDGSQFLIISNTTTDEGEIHNKFACTLRPDTFSFHVGYFRLYSNEAFGVDVMLSKWNSINNNRDTICFLHESFSDTIGQIIPWTVYNRSLSIYYRNSNTPDSARISFFNDVKKPSSSTTFMVLDECKWGYQPPSHKTFVDVSEYETNFAQVYYSEGNLYIKCTYTEIANNLRFRVTDINGQMVYSTNLNIRPGPYFEVFKIPELNSGIYIISILAKNGTDYKKFVVK
jgi:hypothetical protein